MVIHLSIVQANSGLTIRPQLLAHAGNVQLLTISRMAEQ